METPGRIIGSTSGKVRIAAIVLGVIISVALGAWVIILFGHFGQGNTPGAQQEINEMHPPQGSAEEDDENDIATPEPAATPEPVTPPPPGERRISDVYTDIYRELDAIATQYGCVSASLAVYDRNTGESYTYTYGYADRLVGRRADAGTKYCVASLSKLVTAICVMTLVDGELIDLDSDVSNYFGYRVENPNFPDTPITARMLLQHTASVFDSGAFQASHEAGSPESVRELIESGASFRRNKPGTRYEYSDFGYAVLGALCERVTGNLLDTMAREVIFDPLRIDAAFVPGNLRDTSNIAVIYGSDRTISRSVEQQLEVQQSDTPGQDLHLAHGNLTISASDYAKIMSAVSGGGIFENTRILSDVSVWEMNRADVEAPGYRQGLASRYSDNDFIEGEGFYWHPGSSPGIYSQYIYSTRSNRGVVVITSGASTSRLESGLIDVCTELSRSAWKVFGDSPE